MNHHSLFTYKNDREWTELVRRLQRPTGPVDVLLDTDTYNEIDDQYALAYLIKKPDKLNLTAICAAPFYNHKAASPADGMEKSYAEIANVLRLMHREDLLHLVHKGSKAFMAEESTPVDSPAARAIVEQARLHTGERPLYVIAIGALTNVASALLLAPEIRQSMVVVWLGGNAYDWPHNKEFNIMQDVAAARVLFGSGVPLVQLPCMGVVSEFRTSGPELAHWLKGKNELCDYLLEVTTREALETGGTPSWSRAIWDVAAVAWLLDAEFLWDRLEASPVPEYDHRYAFDSTRHPIRYVYHVNRDALFHDLFDTLAHQL